MACAGVDNKCTIVKPDHVGPIPGIHVGQTWKFRIQLSESGVHRPPVGGIAGKSDVGAVSIVMACGYEEDEDYGDEFIYTGSGGRNLSDGNKRVGKQTCNQELTRFNMALARTCDAPFNSTTGNTANNWKNSKAVRVVRSYKLAKNHPMFAPEAGVRYDGIYRLVKYWPEQAKSSPFLVWRFKFRRDDPEPAPWSKEGMERIE
ncbi:the Sra domain of E3 ubiquitin-protein ligase Uhrf2, partial [Dimargaris cristalligena]